MEVIGTVGWAAAADPERDEERYIEGLRRLIDSFR
jgi:hypothetical protein